ncbi:MATE family efflux transporter [Granulicatella elegans]|uniref:Probable multidrug resistance protein NorM n=1 Tax=Granulicatella elegans ATCC 700633 TaxID=626369 RepID=D0BJP3_9LACT|nr:MATE family efflux transporter [Granulicatella elegans]EEW93296.2 MATE efflux family protein [Granulicatella elegans ATCC 700633]
MEEGGNQKFNKTQLRMNIFHIVWPVFIEVLLGSLFGMIDMMMVGRISEHAAQAVSAVGMTNQPVFLGLSFVQALNVGGTAIIARYYGAKKYKNISLVLKHVMLLAMLGFVLPISVLMILLAPYVLSFLGADVSVIEVGSAYFRVIMLGFIFQSFSFTMTAALRGIGETKIPMRNNLIANSLNVLGNAVLIYGLFGFPVLGVTGAAISTALSNVIAMSLNLRYVLSKKSVLYLDFKEKFEFRLEMMKDLIRIGLPTALEQLALRVGIISFLNIVSGLGTNVYAAHQISLNILNLTYSPAQAFGITASTLMGQSLGAKNEQLARMYTRMCQRIGFVIAIGMSLFIFFGSQTLAEFYSTEPEIIQNTMIALTIVAFVQPFQSHQLITSGALRGAGDTVWPLIAIFVGSIVIRVSLGYVFVNIIGLGLAGAWYAVFIDQFIRWLIILFRFRSGKWKNIRISLD